MTAINICVQAEVFVVAVEGRTQAMIQIKHGGDTIKSEPVEVERFQPVLDAGQQEVNDLSFAVVEDFGVPGLVVAAAAEWKNW